MNHCYFLKFVMCDIFAYYMICFFFFCLWSLPLFIFVFVFVLYSPYFKHWPNPIADIINLFCTTNKNLTLPFFFGSLVFIVTQLPVNKEQTDKHYANNSLIFTNSTLSLSLSLSLSFLYNTRERVINTESQRVTKPKSQKAKKRKEKKNTTCRINF